MNMAVVPVVLTSQPALPANPTEGAAEQAAAPDGAPSLAPLGMALRGRASGRLGRPGKLASFSRTLEVLNFEGAAPMSLPIIPDRWALGLAGRPNVDYRLSRNCHR